MAATAADEHSGVTRVEFRANGVLVGSDTSAPYTASWDSATASPGSHTIQARAYDAAGNVANASVGVSVDVSKLTLRASNPYPSYGTKVSLDGWLQDQRGVPAAAGKPVTIEYSHDGRNWSPLAVVRTWTSTPGYFRYEDTPSRKTYYRARFEGDIDQSPAAQAVGLRVWPKVGLTAPTTSSRMRFRHRYTVSGYLKPQHSAGGSPMKLFTYHYERGRWVYRGHFHPKAYNYSGQTKYKASIRLRYKGRWRIRAYHASDPLNSETYSGFRYVTVK